MRNRSPKSARKPAAKRRAAGREDAKPAKTARRSPAAMQKARRLLNEWARNVGEAAIYRVF